MSKNDYTAAGKALQSQHDNSPRSQLVRQKAFLDARMPQLMKWVRGGVRPEALIRFALLDMQNNEKLRQCDPESIFMVLLACAAVGLEPGSLRGECYAVPFSGRATFIMGYRGFIKLARRSGEVVGMVANVVKEHDEFALDIGTANSIVHRPLIGMDTTGRGETIGAYAIATLKSGHKELEWMDREELDKIQRVAEKRGKSPAWAEWPDEQRRKTVIRRLGKRLPLGQDYVTALAIDTAHEHGKEQKEVLDIVTEGAASSAESQASKAPPAPVAETPSEEWGFDPENVQ